MYVVFLERMCPFDPAFARQGCLPYTVELLLSAIKGHPPPVALLHPKPYPWNTPSASHDDQYNELQELMAKSAELPDGEVLGGVIKFHVADGHAYYLVTAKEPLTVQYINFMDGYSIPAAHLRGLLEDDILELVQQEKRWAHAFASLEARRNK
jgi:hypothetical protein